MFTYRVLLARAAVRALPPVSRFASRRPLPTGGRLTVAVPAADLLRALRAKAHTAPAAAPQPGQVGSTGNPFIIKMAGRGGEYAMNLLFIGATLLLIAIVGWPYIGSMIWVAPDVVGEVSFDDVQGCDEAKAEVMEIVDFLQNPEKYDRVNARLPKGVLLYGAPGTGKTMLAQAIAGAAGCSFFCVSGAEMDKMFVGSGAQRVRQIFKNARDKAPSVIFIDEIDAVGGKRGEHPSHQGIYKQTLNQLLTEMDGLVKSERVVVIAATNRRDMLDAALVRPGRFDKQVRVDLPDVRGRAAILDSYLRHLPVAADVDTPSLARALAGLAGADLANLVNQAAIRAAQDQDPAIGQFHLEWAKDKILMGTEQKSRIVPEHIRRLTAYHEAGHALVALHTPGSTPLYKVSIVPRGPAGGVTQLLPSEDEFMQTRRGLEAGLRVAMAGRAAEELIFGADEVTTGASNDIQAATHIAMQMVQMLGMGRLGAVDLTNVEALSQQTKADIDQEVRQLLTEAHQQARRLLEDRVDEVHRLAKQLLVQETLTVDEVREVLASPAPAKPL